MFRRDSKGSGKAHDNEISLGWLDTAGVSIWILLVLSTPVMLKAIAAPEFADHVEAARLAHAPVPATPVSEPSAVGAKRMYVKELGLLYSEIGDETGTLVYPGEELWIADQATEELSEVVYMTHLDKWFSGYFMTDLLVDERSETDWYSYDGPLKDVRVPAVHLLGGHSAAFWYPQDTTDLDNYRFNCVQSLLPKFRAIRCKAFLPKVDHLANCHAAAAVGFVKGPVNEYGPDQPIEYALHCSDFYVRIHYRPRGLTALEIIAPEEKQPLIARHTTEDLRQVLPEKGQGSNE